MSSTKKPKLVFIAGKQRSGKDTFATFLQDYLEFRGKRVLVVHFADKVKEEISKLFGFSVVCLDRLKNSSSLVSPSGSLTWRQFIQHYAESVKECKGKLYWSLVLKSYIESVGVNYDFVLIPDYRYPYESKVFDSYDCVFVKVNKQFKGVLDTHKSELSFDDISFPNDIDNNSDLHSLDNQAKVLGRKLVV